MAKPQVFHYTSLKAVAPRMASAHQAVKQHVASHTQKHKDAIEAHRQKMDANALLRKTTGS